jgi:undecaprenyl diphosphate synthase
LLPNPKHIAIIMDGNGRWAESRGLPRLEGHRRGADAVRTIVRHCRKLGVSALTLYAFSEQNWSRPHTEVFGLMKLLRRFVQTEWDEIMDNGIRLVTIGHTERLPRFVRAPLDSLARASVANQDMILCLALSYGAREEIVDAAKRVAADVLAGRLLPQQIDEQTFGSALQSSVIPWEPDLLVRTSGELRLSNFLLWQAAYTELYFSEKLWPDFEAADLDAAIESYRRRDRRFGAVPGGHREELGGGAEALTERERVQAC